MPDKDGPLLILSRKMRASGPPSLSMIIARIMQVEEYGDFIDLVREYLPERENDILGQTTPSDQMANFASYFEDRYFPIASHIRDGEAESYDELTRQIPVIVRGMGWEEYDSISSEARESIQLMTYLIESPYDSSDIRVSLAEACARLVPAEILQMVPEAGFSLQELHKLLDKTPHEALATWGDMISLCTGNIFLDTDYEMYGYSILPDWDRAEVDGLTLEWQQADLLSGKVDHMVEWLEVDLRGRFEELLNFILQKRGEVKNERKRADGLSVGDAGRP